MFSPSKRYDGLAVVLALGMQGLIHNAFAVGGLCNVPMCAKCWMYASLILILVCCSVVVSTLIHICLFLKIT